MKQEESKLQMDCIKYFDYAYPKLKYNLFSVPNEGVRTAINGARMKKMGRRKGIADIFLSVPKWCDAPEYIYHGFYMEFKTDSGKQSIEQIEFERAVSEKGYKYTIIKSFDQFKEEVENYLGAT